MGKDCRVNTASVAEGRTKDPVGTKIPNYKSNLFSNFPPFKFGGPARFVARDMQHHRRENRIHIREARSGCRTARRDWCVRRDVSIGVGEHFPAANSGWLLSQLRDQRPLRYQDARCSNRPGADGIGTPVAGRWRRYSRA